jgi:hypothetical protein
MKATKPKARARGVKPYQPAAGCVLVMRTCAADLTSHDGFQWLSSGTVTAPDWSKEKVYGRGLHGWLWGCGDGTLGDWSEDAKWLVVEVVESAIVDLGGEVKFPQCGVVLCGSRDEATALIAKFAPKSDLRIIGGTATAGDGGTATAGDGGTAIAGYRGTATAGYRGTAIAGDGGTATAGYGGTATAGDGGTAIAGYRGTATAGDRGTATAGGRGTAIAGYRGTATAGDGGTATAGDGGTATAGDGGTATAGDGGTATAGDGGTATAGNRGTATAGNRGTATAGNRGTATAGNRGTVVIKFRDDQSSRYKLAVGYIGEDGLLPNREYVISEARLTLKGGNP